MKENSEQEKQTPAPKKGMSDFKKAMMWTVISIVVLGVIGLLSASLWFSAGAGLVAAIIAAIVFSIRRKGQIARGIWAGLGIAVGITIVALGITCFVVLSSLG